MHCQVSPIGRRNRNILQIVVPKTLTVDIMRERHCFPFGGHLSFEKTFDSISRNFFWIPMAQDIRKFIMSCRECATKNRGASKPRTRCYPLPLVESPFDRIGMDFVGPLKRTIQATRIFW